MSVDAARLFDAIGSQLILHRSFGGEPPRIGDEYEITRILGAGGFGLICQATQLALRRPVALKLFPLGARSDDSGVREALREARSLARLEHPNIVTVYAAGESELIAGDRFACAFVEMQLIDGLDLREWLAAEIREAADVLALVCAAGRALAHAHAAGMVHRDFKPENLMVDCSARAGQAKVIDFGLALVAESGGDPALAQWDADSDAIGTRATGTGLIRGTPGYMAPEASQGRPRAASDQFALAVVIREALTGRHPFATDPDTSAPVPHAGLELFATIKPAIDRAMSPSPADRWESVAALCDALEQAWPPTSAAAPSRVAPRPRWPWLAGVGASVITAGLLGWGVWAGTQSRRAPALADAKSPGLAQQRPGEPSPAEPALAEAPAEPAVPRNDPSPDEPPNPAALTPSSCADLDAWMGTWEATTKVVWTEYAYQFGWRVDYELELTLAERCSVSVIARKYPPLVEGELAGAPLETTASAVALREASGTWRLPLRLSFPDDTHTYAAAEFYETVLTLDRVGATPRLRGAYRKLSEEGLWIRLGLIVGDRGVSPDPRAITTDQLACAARCRISCAGAAAETACHERACAALDNHPADICGPSSYDFPTPMRAVAAREALRAGNNPFAQTLERGGKTKQLIDCAHNAQTLAGDWGLWLGDQFATLTLRNNSHGAGASACELAGTVRMAEGSVEVDGYVTAAGTWVLTPAAEPAPPAWLAAALVLVGAGEHGPAFGTDTAEPARPLRAFRI